jgi:hypothetical protein
MSSLRSAAPFTPSEALVAVTLLKSSVHAVPAAIWREPALWLYLASPRRSWVRPRTPPIDLMQSANRSSRYAAGPDFIPLFAEMNKSN